MGTLALVCPPIFICVVASLRMGGTTEPGSVPSAPRESAPTGESVVAVVRSAPLAAESEGGMPADLLRIMDDPALARAQTDRVALLYRRWALRNPLGAGQSALANWRLFDSVVPLEAVLEEWLATEPEAAMGWVVAGGMANPGQGGRLEESLGVVLAASPEETRALWAGRFAKEPTAEFNRESGPDRAGLALPEEGTGETDWLVHSKGKADAPRTIKRLPVDEEAER